MDLISVIVPVYKVEKYLDKCVKSIVNQTYKNLEIILVDDGSPDNCGAMCDQWAAKDSRIRVIHQENKGGGAARNAGLDVAKGELIAFVDSDDYIAPNMYTHLVSLLESGADIAECEYVETFDDHAAMDMSGDIGRIYSVYDAMKEHICDHIFRQLIWNKLYRREMVGSIRFPEDKKIDDEFFTYQVLGNAKKLIHSDMVCYAYRQQSNSIMHSISTDKRIQAVEAKVERQEYISEKFPDLTQEGLKALWFTCLYQGQFALRQADAEEAKQAMAYLKTTLREYPLSSVRGNAKEKLWLLLAWFSFQNTCRLRNWLKIGL